jgi:hypothetical protein
MTWDFMILPLEGDDFLVDADPGGSKKGDLAKEGCLFRRL